MSVRVFAYPESVFPPTDFHTATLIGDQLYLIGSLGYARHPDETPVYSLHSQSFRIERLETHGNQPLGLHGHRARLHAEHEIRVEGGKVVQRADGTETLVPNTNSYVLNVRDGAWRALS